MDYFITNYGLECPAGARRAVLEDSIMQKGRPVTAGSKILENFISPLDATVVTLLEAAGITILGKTKMDEFGIAGLFADLEATDKNESTEFISGAVSAVADGAADFALCNDYTGAVRAVAAARGLCYIHPSYGTVSRYGLIHAVSSMDQIGIVCKTPADGFQVLSVIAGTDSKDGAMYQDPAPQAESVRNTNSIRIGVPRNVFARIAELESAVFNAKNTELVEFELKYFDAYAQVMRILCSAEISSNITRYDGIKFGYRSDGFRDLHGLYTQSRTQALGPHAKLAAIFGSMVLSQGYYDEYYDKAMRIRRLIKESLEFDKYDAIVLPASSSSPDYRLALHALPQLCGLPAATIPSPGGGITLIAEARNERGLAAILEALGD